MKRPIEELPELVHVRYIMERLFYVRLICGEFLFNNDVAHKIDSVKSIVSIAAPQKSNDDDDEDEAKVSHDLINLVALLQTKEGI